MINPSWMIFVANSKRTPIQSLGDSFQLVRTTIID